MIIWQMKAVQKSMSGHMPDDKKVISSVSKIVWFLAWQGGVNWRLNLHSGFRFRHRHRFLFPRARAKIKIVYSVCFTRILHFTAKVKHEWSEMIHKLSWISYCTHRAIRILQVLYLWKFMGLLTAIYVQLKDISNTNV